MANKMFESILSGLDKLLPVLEGIYKNIHSNPELSFQEIETAKLIAGKLIESGYNVLTGLGKTGVVGILRNGEGPIVMIRADMDALPVREDTGLSYASNSLATDTAGKVVPIMHACGHDMHVAWLIGAATLFAQNLKAWRGTLIVVFQPAEEIAAGSKAMIDDGLFYKIPKPDVILGSHVMVGLAGVLGWREGAITSTADSLEIKLFGRGAHGSMPQASVDTVVMSASVTLRLQTIVSREISPSDFAVLTIGALQAGTKDNVIPDEALLKINIRTFNENVRKHILSSVERIVNSEATASGAPAKPEIRQKEHYASVRNDPNATHIVLNSFRSNFPEAMIEETQATSASEDFGTFGTESGVPSVFWFVGGTEGVEFKTALDEGRIGEIPTNHSPRFAPVIHPTLEAGVRAMISAAGAWLFF